MNPVAVIEDAFGDGTFEEFLSDFWTAARGEFGPMRRWGVQLSARELMERNESVAESVARQLQGLT